MLSGKYDIKQLYISLTIAIFFGMAQPLNAQNLAIPGHSETNSKQVMPNRGTSMTDVLAEYGEPDQRIDPIGEPPISEWIYGSFRVYFEYQTVLHTLDLETIIMPQQ
jgi:hypothetical protein